MKKIQLAVFEVFDMGRALLELDHDEPFMPRNFARLDIERCRRAMEGVNSSLVTNCETH